MNEVPSFDDHIHQDGFPARLRHTALRFGGAGALARAIGRSEGAVRKWIRGDSEPNVTDLCAICRVTDTNLSWLASGAGPQAMRAEGVQEAAPVYARAAEPALDDDLLESVMAAVDEAACVSGAVLHAPKRSAAVVALYGLFRAAGVVDRKAVSRVVRLAV